jgi:hypothetical protein
MATWTHPLQEGGAPPQAELAQRAVDALNAFRTYVVEHRIWLDPDLAEQVAALDKKLIATAIEFQTYPADDPTVAKERMETWYKVYKRMESDVPDLRKQIEDRFRRLLGVTEET